ncbi:MAG TPA: FAD/NAD(P)-binding oxidoreductase, partial [Anaerolineales bacterium]|nr:FAD/NAD(P)-binding oxidoreductase [Anaerolineales bacterium]
GFLFIPFGIYGPDDVRRAKRRYLPQGVEVIFSGIERIEPDAQRVILTRNSQVVYYDQLIIATGTRIVPEETPGLKDAGWRQNVFDFYTFDGAVALSKFLRRWPGGRVVVNVAEMPIKCPVAPLEFLFLAHAFFHERGMRDKVEIVYATPLPGAFTKPRTAAVMGDMLKDRGIHLESEFNISEPGGLVVRRPRAQLRPAGHHPRPHGLDRDPELGHRRRPALRADRQAVAAEQEVAKRLGDRRRHKPALVEGRLGRAL